MLETARADKRIGKSLEAHVALTAVDAAAAEAVKAVAGMNLAEIFIVSNVSVTDEKPKEGAVVGNGTNFPGLTVAVTEGEGHEVPALLDALDRGRRARPLPALCRGLQGPQRHV